MQAFPAQSLKMKLHKSDGIENNSIYSNYFGNCNDVAVNPGLKKETNKANPVQGDNFLFFNIINSNSFKMDTENINPENLA